MASVSQAKSFWKVLKQVSVTQIAEESHRAFSLALVGSPERRAEALARLYPGQPEESVHPLIRAFDSTDRESGFPEEGGSFDIVIDAGKGRGPTPQATAIYSVDEIGGWDRLVERLLDERPDLALSLARRFPGLREAVAGRVIRETAVANAEFAMLNALPGIVPILGLLLPTTAIGDIVILAKNQAMMMFRLAAVHDLPLDLRARSRDLAPLLGNAFGWRALAREVVGVVPGGVGMVARGMIAYAGTVALGEAVRRLYALGQQPTRAQINLYYRRAYAGARETVRSMAARILGQRRRRRSLPPAPEPESETQPQGPSGA
ncbi:MAG: hypothetical protein IT208_00190 [Chthonomonadales bacterium]|nr:hypothetical protein [Chthonomonadales bacterium]